MSPDLQQTTSTAEHSVWTLLARTLDNTQLSSVLDLIAAQGQRIEDRRQLSATIPAAPESGRYAVLEVTTSGQFTARDELKEQILALSDELKIDIVVQPDTPVRTARKLFAFDMDSTLLAGEGIDELARLAGAVDQVAAITASAMRGEIEFQESFRHRVSLLRGLPEKAARGLNSQIPRMEGMERTLRTLKGLGHTVAVLSGGFTLFTEPLKSELQLDYAHANELHMHNGIVTGEVILPIVDSARKASLLEEIRQSKGLARDEVVAVGDGANDLPMLALAGLGVAFHAKPLVRRTAAHAVTHVGLDGLLYLLGLTDADIAQIAGLQ